MIVEKFGTAPARGGAELSGQLACESQSCFDLCFAWKILYAGTELVRS